MREDRCARFRFDVNIEIDVLQSVFRQDTEAHVHRLGELRTLAHTDACADAVVAFVHVHLEPGHEMHADHLVLVHFDAGHVVAEGVAGLHADRLKQFRHHVLRAGAHCSSPSSGALI